MSHRPNGAFKLLVLLLYGKFPVIFSRSTGLQISVESIRSLARISGTQSSNIRNWLDYLEYSGYITDMRYAPNQRKCTFKLRELSPIDDS